MDQFTKKLTWVLERLTGISFIGLFLVTVLNITLRNLGGITWLWIPGMSRLLFIWTVFLGTAVLYEREDHLIMDFFVNRMDAVKRNKLGIIINGVFFIFLVLLIIYGLMVVRVRINISFETWKFPTAYAYLAAPVSGLLMIFYCINTLRKLLVRRKR